MEGYIILIFLGALFLRWIVYVIDDTFSPKFYNYRKRAEYKRRYLKLLGALEKKITYLDIQAVEHQQKMQAQTIKQYKKELAEMKIASSKACKDLDVYLAENSLATKFISSYGINKGTGKVD